MYSKIAVWRYRLAQSNPRQLSPLFFVFLGIEPDKGKCPGIYRRINEEEVLASGGNVYLGRDLLYSQQARLKGKQPAPDYKSSRLTRCVLP